MKTTTPFDLALFLQLNMRAIRRVFPEYGPNKSISIANAARVLNCRPKKLRDVVRYEDEFLTTAECAAAVGVSLPTLTILRRRGEFPAAVYVDNPSPAHRIVRFSRRHAEAIRKFRDDVKTHRKGRA